MKTMKKKTTAKKPAAKAAPKNAAKPAAKTVTRPAAKTASAGSYTPQAIEGIGWAPFRYPLR